MHSLILAAFILAAPDAANVTVQSQTLDVQIDIQNHQALVKAKFDVEGVGELRFRLNENTAVRAVFANNEEYFYLHEDNIISVHLTGEEDSVNIMYEGTFEQDFSQGEVPGQIHNFSVNAHIGDEGVFLSDGSAWHPQWIDANGVPNLLNATVNIKPVDGWTFVVSGDPAQTSEKVTDPVWNWKTPRPVDGVAIVGNKFSMHGRVHETLHGDVEVVMYVPAEHARHAQMFVDAACDYLDIYVPLLGPFPYKRFSIVENFFSSGFAYPGFTVLGPQVVGMAPRSLVPGYLDHEMVHNWWGNGVYVDPNDGNWCEALTSYCANYFRRIVDGGEEAGRAYRRGILMKLSSDPATYDNGILGEWGSAHDSATNRFVGYDKGSFVLMMLEHGPGMPAMETDRTDFFLALQLFAYKFMGKRASWDDLKNVIEQHYGESREEFFKKWVREATLPRTPGKADAKSIANFRKQYSGDEIIDVSFSRNENGLFKEIDPNFLVYRVLPANQIIPTIAGTMGRGGLRVETQTERSEVSSYLASKKNISEEGENLMLIGSEAIRANSKLIERCANPITVRNNSFVIQGIEFNDPAHAVLHTMHHPDKPGSYITIFHANGDAGWSRLRMTGFYTRDSTVVWQGGRTIKRIAYEPNRKLPFEPPNRSGG